MKRSSRSVALIALGLMVLIGIGLYYTQNPQANASAPAGAPGGGQQQAMPVTVVTIEPEMVQIWNEYSARLEAVNFAEIRPQVSGTITEERFEDGQYVEEGDILFVIDPRPYQAAVNQAKANVNAAKNQSALTWKELKRAKELIKNDAISKRTLDERSSAHSVAVASIKSAEAALESAQINLDYAHVKAPIAGRAGRIEVKKGNLVQAGPNAPLLTTIISTDNIYADFEVDEQSYLKYVRNSARNRDTESNIPVRLILGDDALEYKGHIDSFDNQIDVTSGTIRARALFQNEDGALLPGMFARVKMGTPSTSENILLTERAIGTDQNRKYVYIVNADNQTEYREVQIGESINGSRIIKSGLSQGDQVITEGLIRLRPGMPVKPMTKEQMQAAQQAQQKPEAPEPEGDDAE